MQRIILTISLFLISFFSWAETLLIDNVTLIDGNGGNPIKAQAVLIQDGQITAIGKRGTFSVPDDSQIIDGKRRFMVPGFIDSNVHASIYGNSRRRETVVKYGERNGELVREFAQRQLKRGVTTIRDSYGSLMPLMQVRDEIAAGKTIGPRMLVAGNIIGWGGPFSLTFSLMRESDLTLFQQKWNDSIAQGVGEELMDMYPDELRQSMRNYIAKGPDFLKYGGTSHFSYPSLIGFSPRAQKIIVEEAHRAGMIAETHATSPEGLRLAVEAGIDLIQHPEILSRDYPQALIDDIIANNVICAMRSNTFTGKVWKQHMARRNTAMLAQKTLSAALTSAEKRSRESAREDYLQIERRNAERLINAGCITTIATDNYQGRAPEFRKQVKPEIQEAGIGSILAIEGLVELGMSEMQALVAATKNGAIASGALKKFGTLEVGKSADLLLLDANPLQDIRNIRKQSLVMVKGQIIDTSKLPEKVLFYTGV